MLYVQPVLCRTAQDFKIDRTVFRFLVKFSVPVFIMEPDSIRRFYSKKNKSQQKATGKKRKERHEVNVTHTIILEYTVYTRIH